MALRVRKCRRSGVLRGRAISQLTPLTLVSGAAVLQQSSEAQMLT